MAETRTLIWMVSRPTVAATIVRVTMDMLTVQRHVAVSLYPLVTNGLYHHYHLDESTFVLKNTRCNFSSFISFFISRGKNVSKQNSLRWDATFSGVPSGVILFAYVP